jgi:hypothetical protein
LIPNGVLILYTITYNSTSRTEASLTIDGDSSGAIVTGLRPYTYYLFNVSASTRIGSGPALSIALRTEEDRKCALDLINNEYTASSFMYQELIIYQRILATYTTGDVCPKLV